MRRFVTELTIEECRARIRPAFARFDQFGVPRSPDALFGDVGGGRTTRDGFVLSLRGKPRPLGLRNYALTVRGRFAPSSSGGTTIDVVAGTPSFALPLFVVPLALVLPVVLATILFNAGIENGAWSLAWRWAAVALAAVPGALVARRWWRENLRWLEDRDVAGRWIAGTFAAVEVLPPGPPDAGPTATTD